MFREAVEKLRDNIYVDDLATEEESVTEVKKSKPDSIRLFREGAGGGGGGLSYLNGIPRKQY